MPVIILAGSTGGVGCTTVAVNLAAQGASRHQRVLLVDAAARPDSAVLVGVEQFRTMNDVHAQWTHLHGESVYGYLRVTTSPMNGVRWAGDRPGVWRELCLRYDLVIIDAGTGWTNTRVLWGEVTHWGCVLIPDVCALVATEDLVGVWRDHFIPRSRIALCVNRWHDEGPISAETIAERFANGPQWFFPYDAEIPNAAIDGAPVVGHRPGSAFARGLQGCALAWWQWPATPAGLSPDRDDVGAPADSVASGEGTAAGEIPLGLRRDLLAQLHRRLDEIPHTDDAEATVRRVLREIIAEWPAADLTGLDRQCVVDLVTREAIGLGPLEPLFADDDISEVMVNGPTEIFCERAGRLERVVAAFHDRVHLEQVMQRLLRTTGRRVDLQSPIVDARLPDGARLNIVLPPLTLHSPALTIRRFGRTPWTLARWQAQGSLTAEMAEFLATAVRTRRSLLLIGGTGSGKTSLLGALSAAIPAAERIITIEDAAELQLQQAHVVALQARPPNLEGVGAVTIRDLVRTALRMRPDRIIVGECRGAEALDMLQAMNTGHDGALTTVHANSPQEAMARLATLVCFAGLDLPPAVIYAQIASAIDLIVHVVRTSAGHRRVARVCAVAGCDGTQIALETLYTAEGSSSC